MQIALLSNTNTFKLENRLKKYMDVYSREGYGMWVQELLRNPYDARSYTLAVCIFDGTELFKQAENMEDAVRIIEESFSYIEKAVADNQEINYLISDIDIHSNALYTLKDTIKEHFIEREWEEKLNNLAVAHSNAYILSLKELVCRIGRENAYSEKMWYLSSYRFSNYMEKELVKEVCNAADALEGKRKKCILLDLDNTLWGGVIGEDGIEGISLSENKEGARFKDFQRKIKSLKDMGILLGIVSKNNEMDAAEVFKKHPDMLLKWDDFVIKKINWDNKAQNIENIAAELNLGLDAFVFIDDNPVERELVKTALPQIIVPEFPTDTCQLSIFLDKIYKDYFLTPDITEEDKKKTTLYLQKQKREEDSRKHLTVEEYLQSLQTVIYILNVKEENIKRAVQLVQKTNQFNLTTKRYSEGEIRNMLTSEKADLYLMEVRDRFGSNGQCVLMIVKHTDSLAVEIDTFIMSCRVMGRCLENSILSWMEMYYTEKGYQTLTAKYEKTSKNMPVEELYERMGYRIKEQKKEEKTYEIRLDCPVKREQYAKVIWKEEVQNI